MKDWEIKLDEFLKFNQRNVLSTAGKVSKKDAVEHAKVEYERFEERRREYKEATGLEDTIKQLEEASKNLEDGKSTLNQSKNKKKRNVKK